MSLEFLGGSPTASDRQVRPFSPAVRAGDFIYVSGQVPANAEGEIVVGGIEAQTRQVMENLKAVLAAAGMTFENVVKTTIFITDMDDFATINSVYASYFDEKTAPARETVQVAALPKGVTVEISMTARK